MDTSNLIDFDNDDFSNKIPLEQSIISPNEDRRLSLIYDNPFDRILREISKNQCYPDLVPEKKRFLHLIDETNKENIDHLISPLQSPRKFKRNKKNYLLNITDNSIKETSTINFSLNESNLRNVDESLQILSESVINENLINSFSLAQNTPLPEISFDENVSHSLTENYHENIIKDNSLNKINNSTHEEKHDNLELFTENNSLTTVNISNPLLDKIFNDTQIEDTSNDCKLNVIKVNEMYTFVSKHESFEAYCKDNSMYFEAGALAEINNIAPPCKIESDNLADTLAPWFEEQICFIDDFVEIDDDNQIPASNSKELVTNLDKSVQSIDIEQGDDLQNAKDLISNLNKLLNKSNDIKDQKTFGENLLNSLALALNVETPIKKKPTADNAEDRLNSSFEQLQRSKSDSKIVSKKVKRYSAPQLQAKPSVPKLKVQPVVPPTKLEKNLKPKSTTDKEKPATKGPLKAFAHFTNMVTNKISSNIKCTPQKTVLNTSLPNKRSTPPADKKLLASFAQSTPSTNPCDQPATPVQVKRHIGFPVSPISRPASTNDVSNIPTNKSMSPKWKSESSPNIGPKLNKSTGAKTLTSIPKISRRNSSSDITNKSLENKPPEKKTQIRRSYSFQNRSTTPKSNIQGPIIKSVLTEINKLPNKKVIPNNNNNNINHHHHHPSSHVATSILSKAASLIENNNIKKGTSNIKIAASPVVKPVLKEVTKNTPADNTNLLKKYGGPGKVKSLKLIPKKK